MNRMNDFTKMLSSSPKHRLDSRVTVLSANCRDFDNKCKLDVYQRRTELEYMATERHLKRIQKWQLRAERNNIIKSQGLISDQSQLSPSIDEWLNKATKRRHSMLNRTSHK